MAKDINSIVVVGRLTDNSQLKYSNSGSPITNLSIAVNRSRKQGDEWIDEVSFFPVSVFGRQGEALNQYLTKGTKIAIKGSLKQDRWQKDGENKSRIVILADDIQLLGGNQSNNNHGNNQSYQNNNQNNYPQNNQGNNQKDWQNNPNYQNQSFNGRPNNQQSNNGSGQFEEDITF